LISIQLWHHSYLIYNYSVFSIKRIDILRQSCACCCSVAVSFLTISHSVSYLPTENSYIYVSYTPLTFKAKKFCGKKLCNVFEVLRYLKMRDVFLVHNSIRDAIACPSVCPSVRLSFTQVDWGSQKRLKLGLCNFHHTVATSPIL